MLTKEEQATLDGILAAHEYKETAVIAIMQDIQKEYRYLSQDALSYIARRLRMSEAKVYSVATFMKTFHSTQRQICHQNLRRHRLSCAQIRADFGTNPQGTGLKRAKAHHRRHAFHAGNRILPGACGLAPCLR